MPTSLIAAALPAVISAGAGMAADSLFGGSGAKDVGSNVAALQSVATPKYQAVDLKGLASPFDAAAKSLGGTSYAQSMKTPGLNINVNKKGQVTTGRTPYAQSLIAQLRTAGGNAVGGINALLGKVNPGFGALTDARVGAIDTARQRTTSDLRDSMAQRRISGSSFANDTLSRAEAEFGQAEATARAESFLEELDATAKLLDQRFETQKQVVSTEMAQMNFETEQGMKVMQGVTDSMQQTQQLMSQIMLAGAQANAAALGFNAGAYNTAQVAGTNAATNLSGQATDVDQGIGATFGQMFQPVGQAVGNFFSSPANADWSATIGA